MYIYTIPYQDKFIVYRPLKKLAFLANAAMVNFIVELQRHPQQTQTPKNQNAFNFLAAIGFFDSDPPFPLAASAAGVYQPTVAVLLLTTTCNFRCIYCYAFGGETKTQKMPYALGCRAIDRVCRNAVEGGQGHFTLSFHGGGEPTTAQTTLRKLVEYARSKEIPCHITVATNGYWDKEERDWILDHLDDVSLSFDGIEEVQNHQRPLGVST